MLDQLRDHWHLQAGVEKHFFQVRVGLPTGYQVVETPIEGQLFVHELAHYVTSRNLIPTSAQQALEYTLANPVAQFSHPLVASGEGAAVSDQNEHPMVLSFTCVAGIPAMLIRRQGERLGSHAHLLVLEPIQVG